MDIDEQFFQVFKSFVSDIIKVFPEFEESIQSNYETILNLSTCKIDEQELLKEFLERIHKLNKKITNKDENLFLDDHLLLSGISSKELWNSNISFKTKETIWKYLQTFGLLSLNYRSNKELKEALHNLNENKTIDLNDKHLASDVKKIKKLTENIKETIQEDETETNQSSESTPFSEMEDMMNNSEIGKIAKEVSESLDIESMIGDSENPMDIFQNLLSGDAMGKIMGSINNIVNSKVESGDLSRDNMTQEAQAMYQNMGSNPLFQAMNQMGMNTNSQSNPSKENNPHQSNKTKERLQRKLKNKKVQVNKIKD